MSKGLEALKGLHSKALKSVRGGFQELQKNSIDREYKTIEKELKDKEDIEKELGMSLSQFFKITKTQSLWWKDRHTKTTHHIESEFISIKPYWSIGAGIMFEFSWNDRQITYYRGTDVVIRGDESPINLPHIYLYLRGDDYGKTWALTKEELL